MNTYFNTQSAALEEAFEMATKRGYDVIQPDALWSTHIGYGESFTYQMELAVSKTGNMARKGLTISLYRMGSGRYELTSYIF